MKSWTIWFIDVECLPTSSDAGAIKFLKWSSFFAHCTVQDFKKQIQNDLLHTVALKQIFIKLVVNGIIYIRREP